MKNIPYTTKEKDLREIFSRYGELSNLMLSPLNTIAIVQYANESQASTAAKYLAYYKVNYIMPIYLEFAPEGFIDKANGDNEEEQELEDDGAERRAATVFVKNLNFKSTEVQLEELFREAIRKGKILSVKIIRNKEN